jgi:hypothetical protein
MRGTIARSIGAVAALVCLLIVPGQSVYACLNVADQVAINQYGAGLSILAECTISPPAIASGAGTYVTGTTTADVRLMNFDMGYSGSSSNEQMRGVAFLYVGDVVFNSISNPSATSVTVNNGELGIIQPVNTAASGPMPTQRVARFYAGVSNYGATPVNSADVSSGATQFIDFFVSINGFFTYFDLPLNTPIGLYLQWNAQLTTGGPDPTFADITAHLGGSSLFVLPPDLTVNAESIGLVDNSFVTQVPAVVDIENTFLHPHHDGSGDTAVSALLNDPIPVVVLGSSTAVGDPADLDTDNIDPASLQFGPGLGGISPSHPPEFNLDVDSDGLDDARFTFLMGDAAFDKVTCTDSSGTLTGDLTTGEAFEGSDTFTSDCNASCH